nr:putative ribonuclease h protein [Quercus suber]
MKDIQRIKIGVEGDRDKLRWKENKNGCFSVRTAYRVALRLKQTENVELSTAREEKKKFWNKKWKLPISPKVRNFMRRACFDILPTSANLNRRRVPVEPTCTICKQHDETVAHVLWECPLARNVWAMVRGRHSRRLQKCDFDAPNFYTLARQMEEKLTKKELEVRTIVSWAIWNARNRFHFEEKQSIPNDILHGVISLLQEYQELCKMSTRT